MIVTDLLNIAFDLSNEMPNFINDEITIYGLLLTLSWLYELIKPIVEIIWMVAVISLLVEIKNNTKKEKKYDDMAV